MNKVFLSLIVAFSAFALEACGGKPERQMENLSRGVVAVNRGDAVFVSWRLLGTEPTDLGFNVYRQSEGASAVKLNDEPLTGPTWILDKDADSTKTNSWYVCAVQQGKELEPSKSYTLKAASPVQQYVSIPLKGIKGYAPNDCSVGDLDPDIPGLEVFGVHENESEGMDGAVGPGAALFSARDGKVLFRMNEGVDAGRGVAEDIWDGNRGAEVWFSGSNGLLNTKGERIGDAPHSTNFLIWWDGELTRQLLDGNRIERYGKGVIFTAEDCQSNNGSKSTPALTADIWGDWREELILRTRDNSELRIFTTTIPTEYRMYTLMHDPVYRNGVAWENVSYNQPPHLGFWLGAGVENAPKPHIVLTR